MLDDYFVQMLDCSCERGPLQSFSRCSLFSPSIYCMSDIVSFACCSNQQWLELSTYSFFTETGIQTTVKPQAHRPAYVISVLWPWIGETMADSFLERQWTVLKNSPLSLIELSLIVSPRIMRWWKRERKPQLQKLVICHYVAIYVNKFMYWS